MDPVKSLNKAIDILESFLDMDEEVTLSDVTQATGFDKSTVNRILSTWVGRGYLNQPGKRGKYSLGTKFFDFSGLKKRRSHIRNYAMPHMMDLAKVTRESVVLSILNNGYAAFNEVIPCDYILKIVPDEGTRVPLYSTGVGKILLANMSEQAIDDYINSTELKEHTPNTITHPDILKNHLMTIARKGVAFDYEEDFIGVSNVASGIKDMDGRVVAAVGILGPSTRMTKSRMTEIAPAVMECAQKISMDLGYRDA